MNSTSRKWRSWVIGCVTMPRRTRVPKRTPTASSNNSKPHVSERIHRKNEAADRWRTDRRAWFGQSDMGSTAGRSGAGIWRERPRVEQLFPQSGLELAGEAQGADHRLAWPAGRLLHRRVYSR